MERAAVEHHLNSILQSDEFSSAPKMQSLLRYLVKARLDGKADGLKGYTIGVDVFERGDDFNPQTDSIVRVQVGRLRDLLDKYYHAHPPAGMRIDLPKGGYVPEFTVVEPAMRTSAKGVNTLTPPVLRPWMVWAALALVLVAVGLYAVRGFFGTGPETASYTERITLAVLPFSNMSSDEEQIYFADGLVDAVTTALARSTILSLASRTDAFRFRDGGDIRKIGEDLGVRYVLEGGIQREEKRVRINVQLIDTRSGSHIWAQTYDRRADDYFAAQDELVFSIASELKPQLYAAVKREMETLPVDRSSAFELYLRSTWTPGAAQISLAWEKERVQLAERAVKIDPDFGPAHSVLADKLAYLASVDPESDTEAARNAAVFHAEKALELAGADPDVVFNVALHYWHSGRLQEAQIAAQRVLELDPNHLMASFHVKVIPYTCATAPQSVIDDLVAFDASLSQDDPARWVILSWLARLYLNNGDYAEAADAARRGQLIFATPNTAFALAAALRRLGDTQGAMDALARQKKSWPTLSPRHRAEAAIPRRCKGAPLLAEMTALYTELADVYDDQQAAGGP